MESFVYYTPTKVYFGKDEELKVGERVKEFNPKKVMIHFGGKSAKESGLLDRVEKSLKDAGIDFIEFGGVVANPELSLVRKGIEICKKEGIDFILAVGGGSVMDSSKGIANGVANPDVDVWDFSLGVKKPAATMNKGAILTLSAAGSEMSDSCVITNTDTQEKRGFSNDLNRFNFAIENPDLTASVPSFQVACGTVDIAMHTMERYFGKGSNNSLTDGIAEAVIKNAFDNGIECFINPDNYDARANMMWASSLAHNGLTACGRKYVMQVHQMEHDISGLYPNVAHAAGLSSIWASWARYVYPEMKDRFLKFAHNVMNMDIDFENPDRTILECIDRVEDMYASMGMPISMSELGIKEEDLEKIAMMCSRNKTRVLDGYKPLAYEDILEIYKMAY